MLICLNFFSICFTASNSRYLCSYSRKRRNEKKETEKQIIIIDDCIESMCMDMDSVWIKWHDAWQHKACSILRANKICICPVWSMLIGSSSNVDVSCSMSWKWSKQLLPLWYTLRVKMGGYGQLYHRCLSGFRLLSILLDYTWSKQTFVDGFECSSVVCSVLIIDFTFT